MKRINPPPDWNPDSDHVQKDQRSTYDEMRERCPVAYSDARGWSVFRHTDVTRILHSPETFSNKVSNYVAVPNGMDPPEHTAYRTIIDRYFSSKRMAAFAPKCRAIVTNLLDEVVENKEVNWITKVAQPFAVRVQCAFLGWPGQAEDQLAQWAEKSFVATRNQDRDVILSVAQEFEGFIEERLEASRNANTDPEDDITADLMQQKVDGRPLSSSEIASILRNWTVGEIGTIAASVGILAHYLATHPAVQKQCRAQPDVLSDAADEILRIDGPLAMNRRVTTCPVTINERNIGPREPVTINWIAANRDGRVIPDPDSFRLDRDPDKNLLYGAGIHVCPGAPLARLELQIVLEELLARTTHIALEPSKPPIRATYPASGFSFLSLRLE